MDLSYLHPHYHGGQLDDERFPRHYHDEPLPRHSYEILPRSQLEPGDHRPDRFRDVDRLGSDSRRSRSAVPRNADPPPRGRSTVSSRSRQGYGRSFSEDPAARKQYEHAIEKAIGAGSAAAFHVRNAEGSWVGAKGFKVVGVASAAALIDYTLDQNPKDHKIRHIMMSMLQGGVVEAILRAGENEEHRSQHHGNRSEY